jgi:hypothetical protein
MRRGMLSTTLKPFARRKTNLKENESSRNSSVMFLTMTDQPQYRPNGLELRTVGYSNKSFKGLELRNHRLPRGVSADLSIPSDPQILCDHPKGCHVFADLFNNAMGFMKDWSGHSGVEGALMEVSWKAGSSTVELEFPWNSQKSTSNPSTPRRGKAMEVSCSVCVVFEALWRNLKAGSRWLRNIQGKLSSSVIHHRTMEA